MESINLYSVLFELFGGLGLFIYGMNIMSDGLEKAAGESMKRFIEVLTKNRIMAVIVGALVTMIVQSSSATTVMVVGFVNAGIMNLTQAIGIIMGANIGTTVTAQLVAINLNALAPIAIGLGVSIKVFSKNKRTQQYAEILLGFGLLFLGMDLMKSAVKPLRSYQGFVDVLTSFGSGSITDTGLAILTGFAITAIVQSSSATTGILIALASEGLLPISAAFPVLLGTNIGTTVTAMLSSINANKTAKRAAVMHFLFNVIGTVIFAILLGRFTVEIVQKITMDPAKQLANAHTFFNIANTLLLLPFAGIIVKLSKLIIPITEEESAHIRGIKYLDKRMIETPSIALVQVIKEVLHMGNLTLQSYKHAVEATITPNIHSAKETFELEKSINEIEREIANYLVKLSNSQISKNQREMIDGLFSTINDIERIGDHADNMAEIAVYREDNKLVFSDVAIKDLTHMTSRVQKSFEQVLTALQTGSIRSANAVLEREGEIDLLEKNYRKEHIRRLNDGLCSPGPGVIFLDLISNLERIGDHANNIALAIIDNYKE